MTRKRPIPIRSLFSAALLLCATMLSAQNVFINELHYDNDGGDSGEGVEVAGPAGTDLTGWTIVPYNGTGGITYAPTGVLNGVIPDLGGGFGVIWVPIAGLQNGAPDGIALVNALSVAVQFLSYEGTFLATNGPANGMMSTDIGVSESGTSTVGHSLQLTGSGSTYGDFTWAGSAANTNGAFNNGQTFVTGGCGITAGSETTLCNAFTAGIDTYDLSIPYTGVQAGTTVVNNSGSGSVGGDDPALVSNGTIVISGISETDNYSVTFTAACTTLVVSGSAPVCAPAATVVINEILADPDAVLGDANGDGTVSTSQDEFVEIVNNGGTDLDVSGWSITDGFGVRHVFPAATSITAGCAIVVFAGGTPTGLFGGALVQTASTGSLGLNNGGDVVSLLDGTNAVIATYTYGAEGGNNTSLTRSPDITGGTPLVAHNTAPGSGGALQSPGTQVDGSSFSGCAAPSCTIVFGPESATCTTVSPGPGDTYSVSIPYIGSQAGITVINTSGSGTVGGDDPAVVANGTIVVSGIDEANAYSIALSGACSAVTASGPAPDCNTTFTDLVINEVDYDQDGTDAAEFIEIKNTGIGAVDLAGVKVQLINGSNSSVYATFILPSFSLAAGDYFVICGTGSSVPNCDHQVSPATNLIQNGAPDGVALLSPADVLLDAVTYEGDIVGYTEGSGVGLEDNPNSIPAYDNLSISRFPDGADTDVNNVDFSARCISPGESNSSSTTFCVCAPAAASVSTTCIDDFSFSVTVNVTDMGSSSLLVITDNLYGYFAIALGTGPQVLGPFANNDIATITLNHETSTLCDVSISGITDDCTPPPPCVDNQMSLEISTDMYPDEITWEIVPAGGGLPVCNGGPYFNQFAMQIEACCLTNGCYSLSFFDSFGDGIDAPGGYVLKDANGKRILISDGTYSSIGSAASPFCVPIGAVQLTQINCDREDFLITENVECSEDPTVSAQWGQGVQTDDGYQFWFFDADGGYNRRILRTHANSGGLGPADALRAARLKLSSMVTLPLPLDQLLNVRVRPLVNGVYGEFGPACRFRVLAAPLACPTTKLVDYMGNPNFSCGVTRAFGGSDKISANPIAGADLYRFRFVNAGEGYNRVITSLNATRVLNWGTLPLVDGVTYDVTVQVSFDNGTTWCPEGDICTVSIANPPAVAQRSMEVDSGTATLWPNPNDGEQVMLSIDEVPATLTTIQVDIFDLYGKKVVARTIATQGTRFNGMLTLNGDLASGLYLVNITLGDLTITERLMVR